MTNPTDLRLCKFPGCTRPAEPATGEPGRPVEYCDDPQHTAARAWQARQRGRSQRGVVQEDMGRPVSMATARAGVLRDELVQAFQQLQDLLSRTVETLQDMTDPDAAAAQLETASAEAAARVAEAEVAQRHAESSARDAVEAARLADLAAVEFEEKLAQAVAERDEALQVRDEALEQLHAAEAASAALKEQLDSTRAESEARAARCVELEASVVKLQKDLDAESARADSVASQAELDRGKAIAEAAKNAAAIEVADKRVVAVEGELEEVRSALDAARSSSSRLELELAVATQRANDAERQVERADSAREAADTARLVAEKATTRAESQLEHAQARLKELEPARGRSSTAK